RQLDAEQPFDGHAERHAVRLRAQVVHALDERDYLLPFLLLRGLLDAGVEVTDGRRRRENLLAVELEYETEHAVRAGVLRPHVDGHRLAAEFGHLYRCHAGLKACATSVRATGDRARRWSGIPPPSPAAARRCAEDGESALGSPFAVENLPSLRA